MIAASTHRVVGRMFDCRALAATEVKGLPHPVEAWHVRGEIAGVSRFDAPRADALSPQARLRYFSSPHHAHSPLYPVHCPARASRELRTRQQCRAKLDRLEALNKPTARNLPRDLALMADLLSVPTDGRTPALAVSPQQKREMTITALLDQLDSVAAKSPVLIVFEDVHWIDPTSQDLLDRLVARVANPSVLLVVTVRASANMGWPGKKAWLHVRLLLIAKSAFGPTRTW